MNLEFRSSNKCRGKKHYVWPLAFNTKSWRPSARKFAFNLVQILLRIGQMQKNAFSLQLSMLKVGGWAHFFVFGLSWILQATYSKAPWEVETKFFVRHLMELSSFVPWGSIRGQAQDSLAWSPTFNTKSWRPRLKHFLLASYSAPKLRSLKLLKRLKKKNYLFDLQLLMSKVGGRIIKISLSSSKNKSFKAWSF